MFWRLLPRLPRVWGRKSIKLEVRCSLAYQSQCEDIAPETNLLHRYTQNLCTVFNRVWWNRWGGRLYLKTLTRVGDGKHLFRYDLSILDPRRLRCSRSYRKVVSDVFGWSTQNVNKQHPRSTGNPSDIGVRGSWHLHLSEGSGMWRYDYLQYRTFLYKNAPDIFF